MDEFLDSTEESAYDSDQEFAVERILAEKNEKGKPFYLLLWADYPEERATWEPRENIDSEEILTTWNERKELEDKGLEVPFDVAKFEAKVAGIERAKYLRRHDRKLRRKQLGIPVSSDSDTDYDPADIEATVSGDEPKIVPRRKLSHTQSRNRGEGSDLSTDDYSTGDEKSARAKSLQILRERRENRKNLESPKSNVPQSKQGTVENVSISSVRTKKPGTGNPQPRSVEPQSTETLPVVPQQVRIRAAPMQSSGRGTSAGRGRGTTAKRGGSTSVNVFLGGTRRKRRPNILETSSDPSKGKRHYGNMHIRYQALKASRNLADAAPDLEALGGLYDPSKPFQIKTMKPANLRKASLDAVPQARSLKSTDTTTLRDPVNVDSAPAEQSRRPTEPTVGGNNEICWFWYKQNCGLGYNCRYLHCDDPRLPIALKPATDLSDRSDMSGHNKICFFWHTDGSCKNDRCKFLHSDNQELPVADPPSGYVRKAKAKAKDKDLPDFDKICWWYKNGKCNRMDACGFVHSNDYDLPVSESKGRRLVCSFWQDNKCWNGDRCSYFHCEPGRTAPSVLPTKSMAQPEPNHEDDSRGPDPKPGKKVAFAEDEKLSISAPATPQARAERQDRRHTDDEEPTLFVSPLRSGSVETESHASTSSFLKPSTLTRTNSQSKEPVIRDAGARMAGSRDDKPLCFFWSKSSTGCKFGESCRNRHYYTDRSPQYEYQSLAEPESQFINRGDKLPNSVAPAEANPQPSPRRTGKSILKNTAATSSALEAENNHSQNQTDSTKAAPNKSPLKETISLPDFSGTFAIRSPQPAPGSENTTAVESTMDLPAPNPKPKTKMSMHRYRRMQTLKSLGERAKEVTFGGKETEVAVVDFGDLSDNSSWANTFASLKSLRFDRVCSASDFAAQVHGLTDDFLLRGGLVHETSDKQSSAILEQASNQLRLRHWGLLSVCKGFVILVYPATEEWNIIGPLLDTTCQLQYVIFKSRNPFPKFPTSGLREPAHYRKQLVENVHDLNFPTIFPREFNLLQKGRKIHVYFIFGDSDRGAENFCASWLLACCPGQCILYNSRKEGSWDFFIKGAEHGQGIVLVHERAQLSLSDLPSVHTLINSRDRVSSICHVSSHSMRYPIYPDPSIEGKVRLVQLFGRGTALLLTPSFLASEPQKTMVILHWFRIKVENPGTLGTYKLMLPYDALEYTLQLALDKSEQRDMLLEAMKDDPHKDAEEEARGLSWKTCQERFFLHQKLGELLKNCCKPSDYLDSYETISPQQSSPILFGPDFIDQDDEQSLSRFFAGWAMTMLEQMRGFVILGTTQTNQKKATRIRKRVPKEYSAQVTSTRATEAMDLDNQVLEALRAPPSTNDAQPKTAPQHSKTIDSPLPTTTPQKSPAAENPTNPKPNKRDISILIPNSINKEQWDFITFEPTESWYARWKATGRGWEHVLVGGYDAVYKFLRLGK